MFKIRPTTTPKLAVEAAARALYRDLYPDRLWGDAGQYRQFAMRKLARAALDAADEARGER
jgi:hypothetical protein